MSKPFDRAGRAYWDRVWIDHRDPQLPDPLALTHVERSFAALFDTVLRDLPPSTRSLEIGCANSIWLPHFARRFGFRITGLDYSEIGCAQTRAAFEAAGLDGEIVCTDAFSPPARLLESFDLVFTLGVVEHFDDTGGALAAFSRFLRPGGLLLTVIPNLRGANGLVQRIVNPRVLRMHVPLTARELRAAHARADLTEVRVRYFVPSNFGVLNLNDLDPVALSTRVKEVVVRNLGRASRLIWAVDRIVSLPATRTFGGYVVAVARKRSSSPPN